MSRSFTRRMFFAGSGAVLAAGWTGVALPAVVPPASAAAAESDRARLLANTLAMYAGTAESNARPEVADKLAAIERSAHTRLSALDDAGDGELFAGLPLGASDSNLY